MSQTDNASTGTRLSCASAIFVVLLARVVAPAARPSGQHALELVLARMARVVATMTAEAAKIVPASPVMDAPTPPWQREIQVARMGVASDDTKTFDRDRLKDTHTHTIIARPTSGMSL